MNKEGTTLKSSKIGRTLQSEKFIERTSRKNHYDPASLIKMLLGEVLAKTRNTSKFLGDSMLSSAKRKDRSWMLFRIFK